jgi:acyl-CoA synthetase (AMP-forming)/AMP-acid ligase II
VFYLLITCLFEALDVDSITYMTTAIGIVRAGYVVFPISPRNSPAAVAHLLSAKAVTHVLVGAEQSLQHLITASLDWMKASTTTIPRTSTMPLFEEVYNDEKEIPFHQLPFSRPDMNEPAIILHSSG